MRLAATARASRVLPVPGGPTSSAPLGSFAPISAYFSGLCRKSTISLSASLASSLSGYVGEGLARFGLGRISSRRTCRSSWWACRSCRRSSSLSSSCREDAAAVYERHGQYPGEQESSVAASSAWVSRWRLYLGLGLDQAVYELVVGEDAVLYISSRPSSSLARKTICSFSSS